MTSYIEIISQAILYPFIFLSMYFQVFMLYNFLEQKKRMKKEEEMDITYFPSVTFLVPCWNEEKTISNTIKSILDLDYPAHLVKCIVIDDGSTDNTYNIAKTFEDGDRVIVLTKENGGKHTALNLALKSVKTEFVACLDADSTLDKNSLSIAMQYFKDDKFDALASCMQLRDVKTILQKSQQVEYMLATFWRKAYSSIDAIQVMPGPFSVFKTKIFEEVGDYRPAHNAEDFEMTLRLHKHGYKIANAHKAFVYTVAPSTLRGLYKQRVRWIRGFLENAWDYREMFFNAKYGHFGLFTLPVAFIFALYVVYAFLYTNISLIKLWYAKLSGWYIVGVPEFNLSFDPFYITTDVFMFQGIFLVTVLVFILAVSRQITESRDSLWHNVPLYLIIFPYIMPVFVIMSFIKMFTGAKARWDLQDNKG